MEGKNVRSPYSRLPFGMFNHPMHIKYTIYSLDNLKVNIDLQILDMKEGKITRVKIGEKIYDINEVTAVEKKEEIPKDTSEVSESEHQTVDESEHVELRPTPIDTPKDTSEVSEIPENTETSETTESPEISEKPESPEVVQSPPLPVKHNAVFNEKDLLCKIHSVRIYKPIVDYLIENIPTGTNSLKTIMTTIKNYYKVILNRSIGRKTLDTYSRAYYKYMISNKIWSKDPEVKPKAPNNTAYFLNWLEERTNPYFTIGDIAKETFLSKEKALKIVHYQLSLGNLQQISKWEFAKRKQNGE